MAIGNWFQSKKNRWAVDKLHQSIQAHALRPDFYYEGGARDNFSGRFEMTCLHGMLVFRRLRTAGAAGKALSQDVFDALFEGFDEALRDIGTGDLSVGKMIRKTQRGLKRQTAPRLKLPLQVSDLVSDFDALSRSLMRCLKD